jgi:hypothetical protein
MKKLLLLLSMMALPFATYGQTYFFDDFNDQNVSDWTRYDVDGDGKNWADIFFVPDAEGNPVTPISLISRSWQVNPLTPNNWIVSPAINLAAATGSTVLSWKVQCAAAEWDLENYSVYVSTASDMPTLMASAVTFSEVYNDPANAGTSYLRTLDVSSFNGQTIYVAFRHHNVTDMDFISIDDVKVAAPATSAPDCVTLVAPANSATGVSNPTTTLSWTASATGASADSYDVYLDQNANPTTLKGNASGLTFNATGLLASTTYYWKVIAKNTAGSATGCMVYSFTTLANPYAPYCGPLTYTSGVEPITSVNFGNMTNTSSATVGTSPAHELFLSKIATVEQGSSNTITLKGNTDGNYTGRYIVFIDWNQDGDFLDAGETYFATGTGVTVVNSTGVDAKTAVGTIVVPGTATLGTTRMRIKKNFSSTAYPNPCFSAGTLAAGTLTGFGQAEDYTVNVVGAGLAVSNTAKSQMSVYPNPMKDILNISAADKKVSEVSIYSIDGKLVKSVKENVSNVNVNSLSKGVYIVKVKTSDSEKSFKVIKE